MKNELGLNIRTVVEETLMGTGGAIKWAEKEILESNHDYFFCILGDIFGDYNFHESLEFYEKYHHNDKDLMGLVMQTEVEEPSSFGVIISDDNG